MKSYTIQKLRFKKCKDRKLDSNCVCRPMNSRYSISTDFTTIDKFFHHGPRVHLQIGALTFQFNVSYIIRDGNGVC